MNRMRQLLPPVVAVLLALACTETNGPLPPSGADNGLEPQSRMMLDNTLKWPARVSADQFAAGMIRDGMSLSLVPQGHVASADIYANATGPYSISFWAVAGVAMELEINFQGVVNGVSMSGKFLDFELLMNSLFKRPDGSQIANGDSVQITIEVDPVTLGVTLLPAGLEFQDSHKPKLNVWYGLLNGDLNGDGVVNSTDAAIEADLGIWVRQGAGNAWYKLATIVDEPNSEVRAWLPHFSDYAVSW